MPERVFSEGSVLPDGRKVRVLAYDDGSVRFRLDGTPYVMEEAFLSGGRNAHAIVKLAPRGATAAAADLAEDGRDPLAILRSEVVSMKDRLDAAPDPTGPGSRAMAAQKEGINAALTVVLWQVDTLIAASEEADED